jgi:chromosome segregation ATPase
MSNEAKKKKTWRLISSIVIGVLVVASIILWVLNYRTLETITQMSDKTATTQAVNTRFYMNEFKVTKIALEETTRELEAANVELSTTRTELSSVQQLNDQFRTDIQSLERYKAKAMAKGEALETMINSFKKKNKEMDIQLQTVRKELSTFQPEIGDTNEGRSKVALFKNHIRMVTKNMGALKKQALQLKVAAQKERDRLESLYGNGGFMVKEGQNKSITSFDQKKVEIDVKFINK